VKTVLSTNGHGQSGLSGSEQRSRWKNYYFNARRQGRKGSEGGKQRRVTVHFPIAANEEHGVQGFCDLSGLKIRHRVAKV
jgi:hypothetical protein